MKYFKRKRILWPNNNSDNICSLLALKGSEEKTIEHRKCHIWARISDNYTLCLLLNKLLSFFHAYSTFQWNLQPSLPQSPCSQKTKSSEISKNMTLTHSQCMLHPQLWLDGEVNTSDDIKWFTQTQADIALPYYFNSPTHIQPLPQGINSYKLEMTSQQTNRTPVMNLSWVYLL